MGSHNSEPTLYELLEKPGDHCSALPKLVLATFGVERRNGVKLRTLSHRILKVFWDPVLV